VWGGVEMSNIAANTHKPTQGHSQQHALRQHQSARRQEEPPLPLQPLQVGLGRLDELGLGPESAWCVLRACCGRQGPACFVMSMLTSSARVKRAAPTLIAIPLPTSPHAAAAATAAAAARAPPLTGGGRPASQPPGPRPSWRPHPPAGPRRPLPPLPHPPPRRPPPRPREGRPGRCGAGSGPGRRARLLRRRPVLEEVMFLFSFWLVAFSPFKVTTFGQLQPKNQPTTRKRKDSPPPPAPAPWS
jgi:hypothetical protein